MMSRLALFILGLLLASCRSADDALPTDQPTPPAWSDSGPVVELLSDSASGVVGDAFVLRWTADGADACTASGAWSGELATVGERIVSPPAGTHRYNVRCTNAAGEGSDELTLLVSEAPVVPPAPPPVVTLSADAERVGLNAPLTLSWSATDAESCAAVGDWSGTRAASGIETLSFSIAGDRRFGLVCGGPGGSRVASTDVHVAAPPTVELSADPSTGDAPASVILTWQSTDASACEASGAWSGARPSAGTETIELADAGDSLFALECLGLSGTERAEVVVSLSDPTAEARALYDKRRRIRDAAGAS